MNRNHNLAKPMLGDVLIVKQLPQIKVGLGMEDVLIVVNVVVKYGQKECKVVKRNIVNKGTATSSLIVRVSGISPNGLRLGVCYFALQILQALDKIYRQNNSTKPLLYAGGGLLNKN